MILLLNPVLKMEKLLEMQYMLLLFLEYNLWFVFCGTHKAYAGNKKHDTKYAVNDKFFYVFCATWSVWKNYGSVDKTANS